MLLNWWRTFRRRRILARPFPEAWDRMLEEGVLHAARLDQPMRQKLKRLTQVFIAEKNWEGCRGLEITDEMKVVIAAQACLLVVGMERVHLFEQVQSILVYPRGYVAREVQVSPIGLVIEGKQARIGETVWRGPVILSWADARAGGRRETSGDNLVFHEFAHQLDMLNGRVADGIPLIESNLTGSWQEVMRREFDRLKRACQHGGWHVIDCYGSTHPSEFFAVLTEMFFEEPRLLREHHPEIYLLLEQFYRLDPATWDNAPFFPPKY